MNDTYILKVEETTGGALKVYTNHGVITVYRGYPYFDFRINYFFKDKTFDDYIKSKNQGK